MGGTRALPLPLPLPLNPNTLSNQPPTDAELDALRLPLDSGEVRAVITTA